MEICCKYVFYNIMFLLFDEILFSSLRGVVLINYFSICNIINKSKNF